MTGVRQVLHAEATAWVLQAEAGGQTSKSLPLSGARAFLAGGMAPLPASCGQLWLSRRSVSELSLERR